MPPKKLKPTPAYSSHVEIYTEGESVALTPRTPFSRAGRAEEGEQTPLWNTGVRDNPTLHHGDSSDELDEIDLLQTQSHPLLHSSTLESFPPRSLRGESRAGARSNDSAWKRLLEGEFWRAIRKEAARRRIPVGLLLGCGGAILLLILLALSVKKQDALLNYIGVNTTAIAYESLDDESKARFNSSRVVNFQAAGYKSFPLTTSEYVRECWKLVNDPRMKYAKYWTPRPGSELDVLHQKSTNTCSSTITYILDGSVGLFADLAHLAQAAAFARERNRTLFIYDERWNRGKWTDHFLPFSETQPGPEPGCIPPPPEELVSCPRTVRHWVTSAKIMYFHLESLFMDTYEDAYKYTIERSKPIFDRALESFTTTIIPSLENQRLIKKVRDEVVQVATKDLNMSIPLYIATHIRRGDRKALTWRYQKTESRQVPIEDYSKAFWGTYSRIHDLSNLDETPSTVPFTYLASDSPEAAANFTEVIVHNDTLVKKYNNEHLYAFVYELRTSDDFEIQQLASSKAYIQAEWNEKKQKDRIRETRGVIIDWALMTGFWQPTSDDDGNPVQVVDQVYPVATVCAFTSNMCTLALLGLGWQNGFDWTNGDVGHDPNWVEVDNGGSIAPIWRAFENFA